MNSVQAVQGILPILDAGWLERQELSATSGLHRLQSGRVAVMEKIARSLGESAVTAVQLRCKTTSGEARHFVGLWMQLLRTWAPDVVIVVNDHVKLAAELAADGVHVGQEDTPVSVCRQILGSGKIVGLSTHSVEEVSAANQARMDGIGPDYVGFGPVFATNSKPDARPTQGLIGLAAACRIASLPVVAIGGIQSAQLKAVAATGAAAAAMIGGLWEKDTWLQRLHHASVCWHV